MDFRSSIIRIVGLQDVDLVDLKIFNKDLRIELVVRQKRDSCFCTKCGLQFDQVKDWELKYLKAPPLGVFQRVEIKLYQMRGYCSDCNRSEVCRLDWIHPRFTSMTCGFAEVAGRLMEEITCEAVARILHTESSLMWYLDQWRMEYMLQFLKLPRDIDLSYLSADEVHFRSIPNMNRHKSFVARRHTPEFITNLVSYNDSKIIANSKGRDSQSLKNCLAMLSPGQRLSVERFAVDMHEPFISVIHDLCPNAKITVDRFHVTQSLNRAFDELRKDEFNKAKKNHSSFEQGMLEPSRRFMLVTKHPALLSQVEQKLIERLKRINDNINTGLILVEYLHKALDKKTIKGFRQTLSLWYQVVRESQLPPFLKFAKLIRKYRKHIEVYIQSRLTTAVSEGLNNKIKVLKRMGYGYTNKTSFMRKILQRCGYLNHVFINTDKFLFHVPNPAI
jgi:transposase